MMDVSSMIDTARLINHGGFILYIRSGGSSDPIAKALKMRNPPYPSSFLLDPECPSSGILALQRDKAVQNLKKDRVCMVLTLRPKDVYHTAMLGDLATSLAGAAAEDIIVITSRSRYASKSNPPEPNVYFPTGCTPLCRNGREKVSV